MNKIQKIARKITASYHTLKYTFINVGKEIDIWFESDHNGSQIDYALYNLNNEQDELTIISKVAVQDYNFKLEKNYFIVNNGNVELHIVLSKKDETSDEKLLIDYLEDNGAIKE